MDFIDKLHKFVTQGITPNLTFLIDLDPIQTIIRKNERQVKMDRLDQENLQFHRKVREGYLKIARAESHRYVTIDGSQPINDIQEQTYKKKAEIIVLQRYFVILRSETTKNLIP